MKKKTQTRSVYKMNRNDFANQWNTKQQAPVVISFWWKMKLTTVSEKQCTTAVGGEWGHPPD